MTGNHKRHATREEAKAEWARIIVEEVNKPGQDLIEAANTIADVILDTLVEAVTASGGKIPTQ